jgi:hypothetical protein
MKWVISDVTVYSPQNKKQGEFNDWAEGWKYSLLPRDIDKDAFIEEVRYHIKALNEYYPKTKPLCVTKHGTPDFQLCVEIDCMHTVAIFRVIPIVNEFRFSEKVEPTAMAVLTQEGGSK